MDTIDSPAECRLSTASFARFARFITGELGIKMPPSKISLVQSRLLRRVRELHLDSVEQYGDFFFAEPQAGERDHLINAITTNKTDFFREPEHFDYLANNVLPEINRLSGAAPCRMKAWSAGCSSGEEAYTLAMVLNEHARRMLGFDFAILGTDVSTRVLDQARSGIYRASQTVPVPPEFRLKYLLQSRDQSRQLSRIVPELRSKTSFHRLNFIEEYYPVKDVFDVIFFRNVMIYFDRPTQQAVINKLCRHLAPGAYLFTGHSESLAGLNVPVKCVQTAIFRKSCDGV